MILQFTCTEKCKLISCHWRHSFWQKTYTYSITVGCQDKVFESSLKCLVGSKLKHLPKKKKRTLQKRRMTIEEIQIMAGNDYDCMDKPWALLILRLSHATFRHPQSVTCHGLTRPPKPETLETQGLPLTVFNISLRSTSTDNIQVANRESWRTMPSHLQTCSSFFPSDRYLTSESRGYREFYVETNEAGLWCIKRNRTWNSHILPERSIHT